MRWTLALVAVLLLAGADSDEPSADTTVEWFQSGGLIGLAVAIWRRGEKTLPLLKRGLDDIHTLSEAASTLAAVASRQEQAKEGVVERPVEEYRSRPTVAGPAPRQIAGTRPPTHGG